jgi:hypothetical protein
MKCQSQNKGGIRFYKLSVQTFDWQQNCHYFQTLPRNRGSESHISAVYSKTMAISALYQGLRMIFVIDGNDFFVVRHLVEKNAAPLLRGLMIETKHHL